MALVLAHLFNKHEDADRPWLLEHASMILGMVDAGATDFHVNGYLKSVLRTMPEFGDTPPNEPTPERLSHWLASRLLDADEMAEFESEADDHSA